MSFTYYGPNPAGHDQERFPGDTEPPGEQPAWRPSRLQPHTEPFERSALPSIVGAAQRLPSRETAPGQIAQALGKGQSHQCDSAEWPRYPSILSPVPPTRENAVSSFSTCSEKPPSRSEIRDPLPADSWSSAGPPTSASARSASRKGGMENVPNLLAPGREEAMKDIRFRLNVRQQPQAARACGFGDRDRRVIDPPPIIQLRVEGPSLSPHEIRAYLRYESYVLNCSIYDESGTHDASLMPDDYQNQRRLMGSLVGTPFFGVDDQDLEGCFFCFSDLSCRTPGAYRLKFTLLMIDPFRAGAVRHFPAVADVMTDTFHVYSAKEFPGMLPSTSLAKRLKEQGCIISIKKGNERVKNTRSQGDQSDDAADGDDGENAEGHRKRRNIDE